MLYVFFEIFFIFPYHIQKDIYVYFLISVNQAVPQSNNRSNPSRKFLRQNVILSQDQEGALKIFRNTQSGLSNNMIVDIY